MVEIEFIIYIVLIVYICIEVYRYNQIIDRNHMMMEDMNTDIDSELMSNKQKVDRNENKILKLTNIINNYLKTIRGNIH